MCGRFTMAYENWSDILDYFGLTDNGFRYPPQYNIAPSQNIISIISDGKERRAGLLKWGLIPSWSETDQTTFKTFNARAETLLTTPTYKNLVSRKRTVIIADGFVEWPKSTKKPHRIRVKGHEIFGMAGLYDTWVSPDGKRKIHSCTIITCEPNFFMKSHGLHDRMPVILDRSSMNLWLDRNLTDKEKVMSLLRPYDGEMYAYRVPELIGNVRNNGPECIEAI